MIPNKTFNYWISQKLIDDFSITYCSVYNFFQSNLQGISLLNTYKLTLQCITILSKNQEITEIIAAFIHIILYFKMINIKKKLLDRLNFYNIPLGL